MEREKTIFQKIIDREIPADIVYEDAGAIAFFDINPTNPGHTLVVPKAHYEWWLDVPENEAGVLFVTAQKIGKAIKAATSADFVEVFIWGTDVPHVHIHLIPHQLGDQAGGPKRGYDSEEYKNQIKQQIIDALE